MKSNKVTLKQAGYVKAESIGNGAFVLRAMDGKREIWLSNKGHASYGIKWKNTHLEFMRSVKPNEVIQLRQGKNAKY